MQTETIFALVSDSDCRRGPGGGRTETTQLSSLFGRYFCCL